MVIIGGDGRANSDVLPVLTPAKKFSNDTCGGIREPGHRLRPGRMIRTPCRATAGGELCGFAHGRRGPVI